MASIARNYITHYSDDISFDLKKYEPLDVWKHIEDSISEMSGKREYSESLYIFTDEYHLSPYIAGEHEPKCEVFLDEVLSSFVIR